MSIVDCNTAMKFAEQWIDAWNRRDLEAVLCHYTEDFVFASPLIPVIAGEPSGVLRGKSSVRAYWAKGLERIPNLKLTLHDVMMGVNSIVLVYRGHRGMVAETFILNKSGLVKEAMACYGASE
ncbi:MAG: nuclear transport factor 2 family protein [Hydrogenophilales bacterium]|nr:nuclear transport factor 2 family protein [Hydrogenophilales bacterium]